MIPYLFVGVGGFSLVLFLIKRDKYSSVLAISLKTITSICFVIVGVASLYTIEGKSLVTNLLIILGLVFGLIGDIVLDFKIYFKGLGREFDSDLLTYFGMISFGLGHILYISGSFIEVMDLWVYLLISLGAGAILIILILLLSIKVMKMNYNIFLIPSGLYGFLLASFVVFSIFRLVNYQDLKSIFLMMGSVFFIISDLILSMTYFSKESDYQKDGILNPESRFMISTNHITYYIAQFLIAICILFV
jgi:hypothetical protein